MRLETHLYRGIPLKQDFYSSVSCFFSFHRFCSFSHFISFYNLFFLLFTVIFCFIFNFWLPFTLYICHLFVVMVFVCRLFYFYFADRCTNKNNTRTHTRTILQASHTNTGTHTHTNTGTLALNFFSSFSLRLFHFYALYTTASIYLISVSAFR